VKDSHRRKISRPFSVSTPTRCCARSGCCRTKDCSNFAVAGTPERGAVMQKVRELVEFARGQGYAVDELVEMIENVA
jgi:hypothetical protein